MGARGRARRRGGFAVGAARRLARGPLGRVGLAAALQALGALVRRHPRAALDMLTSGAAAAGRVGAEELSARLRPAARPAVRRRPARLSAQERRRLRAWLAEKAQRDPAATDVASS
jgi:hypothetical protein